MSGSGGGGGKGRVSAAQLEALLSFMEEHREVAAGRHALLSRFAVCRLWRLLAERLNALAADAGVRRSPDKWCRYWADIKYKARKKWMSGGALGELSHVEERLKNILDTPQFRRVKRNRQGEEEGGAGGGGEEEDPYGAGLGGAAGSAEELVAEAAMRSALAAERQAEATAAGVELLRDLVAVLRDLAPALRDLAPALQGLAHPAPPPPHPAPPHPAPPHPHAHVVHTLPPHAAHHHSL